jgi:eukaryotic-like serine/threonine-protein kinase
MLSVGDLLKARYRIDRMLDIGALEGHYGGWDLESNEPVLIKELLPQPDLDPETLGTLRARFERDAASIAGLDHPHIVRVVDYFCSPSNGSREINAYLIEQAVQGLTLAEIIQREGAIRETRVTAWAEQLLDGLAHAHARGICHRDIKPDKILITPDDQAMLTGFEIVALWNPLDPRTWTAKRVMGTPHYAPPECWGMKMTHVDSRSDIYTLGAALYHTLTGEQPLTAGERTSNPYRFLQVKALNPKVGTVTRDAVLKAMELPRDKRFQSAEEMAQALRKRSEYSTTAAPPPASIWPAYGPRPWARNSAPTRGVLLVVMLVIALAGLGVAWLGRSGFDWQRAALTAGARAAGPPSDAGLPAMTGGRAESAYPVATAIATAVTTPALPAAAIEPAPLPADLGTTTPTPDPTPTRPALARPELSVAPPADWQDVIDDSFSDNRNGWLINNHEDDWGTISRQVTGGTYRWTVNATLAVGRWSTLDLRDGASALGDFHAGVDARRERGPEAAAYGLILRQFDGGYYVFSVRDDGYYQFNMWAGYEWRPIIDWTETTAVRSGEVNRLTVRAEGSRFALFINDQRVAQVENDEIKAGKIGLSISTAATQGDAVFTFDNFTLWTP